MKLVLLLAVLVSSAAFANPCAEAEKEDYAIATERFGSGEVTITDVAQTELDFLKAKKSCEKGDAVVNLSVYCWEAKRAAKTVLEGRTQEFAYGMITKEVLDKADEQMNRVNEQCEREPN